MSEPKPLFEIWMELFLACLKRDSRLESPEHTVERARETANAAMDVVRRARAQNEGIRLPLAASPPDHWQWVVANTDGSAHICLTADGHIKLAIYKAPRETGWLAQVLRTDNGDVLLDECGYGSDVEAKAACVTVVILYSQGRLWRSGSHGKKL